MVIDGRFKDFDHFLDHVTSNPIRYTVFNFTVCLRTENYLVHFGKSILSNLEKIFGTPYPIFEISGIVYKVTFPDFGTWGSSPLVLIPL